MPSGTDLAVDGVAGNSLEVLVEMDSAGASEYGVKVCVSPDGQEETTVSYDAEANLLKVDTRKSGPQDTPKAVEEAPFELKDGLCQQQRELSQTREHAVHGHDA